MQPAAESYGSAFADVYDEWYANEDVSAAVRCLTELSAGGASLELGIGTGRVGLPLARAGVEVWGIDESADMLRRLAEKDVAGAVRTIQGDMTTLLLPFGAPRFALVYVPFNTFFLLRSERAQRACLARCHDVLCEGGRVALELYCPAPAAPFHRRWEERSSMADGTEVVLRYERSPADPQLLVGCTRADDGRERPWSLRPLSLGELDSMARDAGFELAARWASWSRDRFYERHGRHVSVFQRG